MNNAIKKILLFVIVSTSIYGYGQQELSQDVLNDMKYMVEEEKLAKDVYEHLGELWSLRIFKNILQSEQQHMEMMENLLKTNKIKYKLSDERGVFFNRELQKMYNQLIDKGSKSQKDALQVGKLIEETDITDLEDAIANTNDAYITQVYSNLLRASRNHLKAFNRQL